MPGLAAEVFRATQFYDALGRVQTAVDNLGHTEDYRYDSRGNLVASADARGPLTTRTIQRRGLGSAATVTVNDYGNVTLTYVDGIGRTLETQQLLASGGSGNGSYIGARHLRHPLGPAARLLWPPVVRRPAGIISTYFAYDDNSQLLARRDDNGNVTAWVFDNREPDCAAAAGAGRRRHQFQPGRRRRRLPCRPAWRRHATDTEPTGTDIISGYDRDSQPTGRTDEAGNVLSWTNDALGRPTFLAVSAAAGFAGTTLQTWQYDGLGRPTLATDNNDPAAADDDATTTRFYDSLSRPVEEQQRLGALPPRVVSWSYDIAYGGAVAAPTSLVYPDGRQLDSTYDRLDRLVSRGDSGLAAIGAYEYLGPGRVATLTYQNNTRLTRIGQVGGVNADVGFDGVQRVVNHRWEAFTPGVTPLGGAAGRLRLRDGGEPVVRPGKQPPGAQPLHDLGNSETYNYQSDGQLRAFARGTLDGSGTTVVAPDDVGGGVAGAAAG
jgi:YD repeat-containing protein